MHAGPHNAITDVGGVTVGHCTRDDPGWLTGVTVVVPPQGTVGGADVRGGGPGTRETDLLDPRCAVDAVDAVVLAGGSAYGLGTADGVLGELYAAGRGWPVGPPGQVVPIVPAAIVLDLGRSGVFAHWPTPQDGAAAYRDARSGPVAQGNVGAGTGAQAGGLKGGVGTASMVLDSDITVGALVVCNAVGSAIDLRDGTLLGTRLGLDGEFAALGTPDPEKVAAHRAGFLARTEALRAGMATTIAVIATDATLTKAGCAKLAGVAHDGMARALSPVHTAYDGDTVFALATCARPRAWGVDLFELQTAAADCLSRAIAHAMAAARPVDRRADGGMALPAWSDLLPNRRGGPGAGVEGLIG